MNANPYSPTSVSQVDVPAFRSESRQFLFVNALLAGIAAFGIAYLTLCITVSLALHGTIMIFPIHDIAYIVYLEISLTTAAVIVAASLTRCVTHADWAPPLSYICLNAAISFAVFLFGFPGAGGGAIDLSLLLSICILGLTPFVVGLTMVRIWERKFVLLVVPYITLSGMFVCAATGS